MIQVEIVALAKALYDQEKVNSKPWDFISEDAKHKHIEKSRRLLDHMGLMGFVVIDKELQNANRT